MPERTRVPSAVERALPSSGKVNDPRKCLRFSGPVMLEFPVLPVAFVRFRYFHSSLARTIVLANPVHLRENMIEGQDIICFSNDWDGDPLSKKHIMTRLARKNRVLWVNSLAIRRPKASMYDARRVFKKLT